MTTVQRLPLAAMASMKRTRRAVAVGARSCWPPGHLPLVSALTETAVTPQAGQGQCHLAWFRGPGHRQMHRLGQYSAPAWSVGTNGVYINPAQPGQSVLPPSHPGYGG